MSPDPIGPDLTRPDGVGPGEADGAGQGGPTDGAGQGGPADGAGPGRPAGGVGGYPVVLPLAGRRCLVVGGGPVATRRAEGISAAGGSVTVVAPAVLPRLEALPGVVVEHRRYRDGEAGAYALVVTATGDVAVDRRVVADAVAAGVPVAGSDRAAPGSILLPAVHRDGPVTVAVASGGASPALSRWLLRRVAAALPDRVAVIADLVEEARAALQRDGRATDTVDWETLLDHQVVPLVEQGRIDEARRLLRGI